MERAFRLLVVDDDRLIIDSMRLILPSNWELEAVLAPIGGKNITALGFHAAFVDIHLSNDVRKTEGLNVIKNLNQQNPHLEIVAISGDLDREIMEKGLKNGATRFLAKPLDPDEIKLTLEKIEAFLFLRGLATRPFNPTKWIGNSAPSLAVKQQVANLKGESGPILIEGESGTGKEIVARLLHEQEERGPLISVNVAGIPETLFESEFFGHVKGSFTGADQNKMGLAEMANQGDLFLDEIEALPLSLQVKLLRFLENFEVRRVGARDSITVHARIILATNQDLSLLVKQGKFREDLLWRISGKKIKLPALREHPDDIVDLVNYFMAKEARRRNKSFGEDALQVLSQYSWPGNVRELRRVCEQLLLVSPLPIIRREDVLRVIQPNQMAQVDRNIDFSKGLTSLLNEYESSVISFCLQNSNDIDDAARRLQISRSSLYKKIKDYNIAYKD